MSRHVWPKAGKALFLRVTMQWVSSDTGEWGSVTFRQLSHCLFFFRKKEKKQTNKPNSSHFLLPMHRTCRLLVGESAFCRVTKHWNHSRMQQRLRQFPPIHYEADTRIYVTQAQETGMASQEKTCLAHKFPRQHRKIVRIKGRREGSRRIFFFSSSFLSSL